jgi:hypothetical protein
MSDNLKIWERVEQPPEWALKTIQAGRLKGKTDINPQWRLHVMTEVFGPCGQGWWFTVDKQWLEPGANDEVAAFVNITLYTDDLDKGVPGTGGASFIASEKHGLHTSDEAFKMALTDALSVAMKFLGVAARIYYGAAATKYSPNPASGPPAQKKTGTKKQAAKEVNEEENKLKAEAAFNTAWDKVMDSIGEDEEDNAKVLRQHFFKSVTEKSSAFLAMSDSTAGMNAKEVKLITAMLTKGDGLAKTAGLCAGKWRTELGLPSLGVEVCEVCGETLTPAEKSSCAIAKLPGHWCTKHVTVGVKKAQELKNETV